MKAEIAYTGYFQKDGTVVQGSLDIFRGKFTTYVPDDLSLKYEVIDNTLEKYQELLKVLDGKRIAVKIVKFNAARQKEGMPFRRTVTICGEEKELKRIQHENESLDFGLEITDEEAFKFDEERRELEALNSSPMLF